MRRWLVRGAAALLAVAVLVGVGRWQENRDVRNQRRGMARIFADAAAVRVPDGWRITTQFRCLLYRSGPNPFAFELCFDSSGGLVEAIDRRSGRPVVSSLRFQTGEASIHVASTALNAVLRQMAAFAPSALRNDAIRYPKPGVKRPPPRIPPGSGLPSARA